MKNKLFLILVLVLTLGCETSEQLIEPQLDDEIQINIGGTVTLEKGDITITFKSISEDSRCPEGATCIWEGNAKVLLEVSKNEIALNTSLNPKEETIGRYTVQLRDVLPYPKLKAETGSEPYRIKIVVSKN